MLTNCSPKISLLTIRGQVAFFKLLILFGVMCWSHHQHNHFMITSFRDMHQKYFHHGSVYPSRMWATQWSTLYVPPINKNTCVNYLLKRDRRKRNEESFSYDNKYPLFHPFLLSPLNFNFPVLRRNHTLSSKIHLLQFYVTNFDQWFLHQTHNICYHLLQQSKF